MTTSSFAQLNSNPNMEVSLLVNRLPPTKTGNRRKISGVLLRTSSSTKRPYENNEAKSMLLVNRRSAVTAFDPSDDMLSISIQSPQRLRGIMISPTTEASQSQFSPTHVHSEATLLETPQFKEHIQYFRNGELYTISQAPPPLTVSSASTLLPRSNLKQRRSSSMASIAVLSASYVKNSPEQRHAMAIDSPSRYYSKQQQ